MIAVGRRFALVLAASACFGACARSRTHEPPIVRYGEDVCFACNMIVSEESHAVAAAVEPEQGRVETRLYDDVGCLLGDEGAAGAIARWVHDLEEGRWIAADSASFVRSDRLQTPMGSGVAAFATRARADAYAAREGTLAMSWTELAGGELR